MSLLQKLLRTFFSIKPMDKKSAEEVVCLNGKDQQCADTDLCTDPFVLLANISWGSLTHAYGTAEDVPGLLRSLMSFEDDEIGAAYEELYGNVYHQGTRWEVSPVVMPVLFAILNRNQTKQKSNLIDYILYLALGFPDRYTALGLSSEQEEELNQYQINSQCWQNFISGQKILREQSFNEDLYVRIYAIYALSLQSRHFEYDTLCRIKTIANHAELPLERAGAILCLGIAEAMRKKKEFSVLFKEKFATPQSFMEKVCSAVSILAGGGFAGNTEEVLFLASLSAQELAEIEGKLPYCNGSIKRHISQILCLAEGEHAEKVLSAMTQMLPNLGPHDSFVVTSSMLHLIWTVTREQDCQPFRFEDFSPVAQSALRAIARYGAWTIGERSWSNYLDMIGRFGFPAGQQALFKFTGLDSGLIQENKPVVFTNPF